MSRWLIAAFILFALLLAGGGFYFKSSAGGVSFLPLVVAASALLDSANPCAFSVLLLTIAFLFSLGRSRRAILGVGVTYITGIFLAYIAIGLGLLGLLQVTLGANLPPWFLVLFGGPHLASKIGAVILIIFGLLDLVGEAFPSFPIKLKIPQSAHQTIARLMQRASYPAVFLLGAAVGLYEFPCTGGPYLFVLGLLHDHATYLRGLLYLVFYNLIFVLPLVVVLVLASQPAVLQKFQAWKKSNIKGLRFWTGLGMVLLGVLLFVLQ
ncbi:MAG: hypothetical protein HY978_02005 [Candidatus Liptonbacteria bacterium]|nr:hypothetical protein [Candidatus Liptonbacteria bacterium]